MSKCHGLHASPAGAPPGLAHDQLGGRAQAPIRNRQDSLPVQPPPVPASGASQLIAARQLQWSSGIRTRKCSTRSWQKPRPKLAKKPKTQSGDKDLGVDCPDTEHVLLDGPTGIPLQVLSLNLGISGLKGSLDQLSAYLRKCKVHSTPAVLHLQEARLRTYEVQKWRKRVSAALPEFSMYAHCRHSGLRNTTAVVTLICKEMVKWVSPLSVKSPDSILSGRLVALKYAPPNVPNPVVLANAWMPHSGYKVAELEAAHKAFGDLVSGWKQQHYVVLAAGDWNAAICPDHRPPPDSASEPGPTGTLAADRAFQLMMTTTGLHPTTDDIQPTWESSTGKMRSRIDHAICTDCSIITKCDVVHDITVSDHSALLVHFHREMGCWNAGQHKPISMRPSLNLGELDNLAPQFQHNLTRIQDKCTDLASLEQAMWQTATDVFGLKQGHTGRKPFVNNTVLRLKQAIKAARTLLYMYNRGAATDTVCTQWGCLREHRLAFSAFRILHRVRRDRKLGGVVAYLDS